MQADETISISCLSCKGTFTLAQLVDGIYGYARGVGVFVSKIPCCGAVEELQIRSRTVTRGYTYSSGSLHFEGVEDYLASGLHVHRGDTEFEITHHGRTWKVPIPPLESS